MPRIIKKTTTTVTEELDPDLDSEVEVDDADEVEVEGTPPCRRLRRLRSATGCSVASIGEADASRGADGRASAARADP